jgi:hypothetical protein
LLKQQEVRLFGMLSFILHLVKGLHKYKSIYDLQIPVPLKALLRLDILFYYRIVVVSNILP